MTPSTSFEAFVRRCLSVLAGSVLFAGSAQAGPTLTVVAGKLTGAAGVNVGGVLYDVEFDDGTCIALLSGCDSPEDFVFQSAAAASDAAQALLDQVFVGSFDTSPGLTAGCDDGVVDCHVWTPFNFGVAGGSVRLIDLVNTPSSGPLGDLVVGDGVWPAAGDTSADASITWAVWAPAGVVPEPSRLALLGLGGVALGWSQRRRRRRAGAGGPLGAQAAVDLPH